MSAKEKSRMVRLIIRVAIYLAIAVGVFIVLKSVMSVPVLTFTINWVKLYVGIVMLTLSSVVYTKMFCRGGNDDKR